jgi:hypothetical protein
VQYIAITVSSAIGLIEDALMAPVPPLETVEYCPAGIRSGVEVMDNPAVVAAFVDDCV